MSIQETISSSFLFLLIILFISCSDSKLPKKSSPAELNARLQDQGFMKTISIPDSSQGIPPDFNAKDLNGDVFVLSEQKGRIVVLNFWGTWCGPCIAEIPEFIALQKEFSDQQLTFVGISTPNEPKDSVKVFAKKMGINYPIIYDVNEKIINRYKPHGWPSTYLIGKDGKLKKCILGTTNKKLLKPVLVKLLEDQ